MKKYYSEKNGELWVLFSGDITGERKLSDFVFEEAAGPVRELNAGDIEKKCTFRDRSGTGNILYNVESLGDSCAVNML